MGILTLGREVEESELIVLPFTEKNSPALFAGLLTIRENAQRVIDNKPVFLI